MVAIATTDPLAARAKRELRVWPATETYPRPFDVYWKRPGEDGRDEDVLHVPRFWNGGTHGTRGGSAIRASFRGSLRSDLEQPDAVLAVMESLRRVGGALLSLRTGAGKTTCACYVAAQLQVKTVVLVHKDVLRTQWAERISQFLPGTRVSFVQGTCIDTSGDIVVAMIQTLMTRTVEFPDVGFVIVDECHHIGAESFGTAMRTLNDCRYSLGLSATPTRKDGLVRVVHWFLGPMAYASSAQDMKHVVVEIVRYSCDRYKLPPPTNRYGINTAAVISDIADDTARTALVVSWIQKVVAADPRRVVLVLSHRRDHCTEIASKVPGAIAFLGGAKKKHSESVCASLSIAPVICATFALAAEGFDLPRLNTLVLATPCSDVTQAVGRILRGSSAPDAPSPLIVDICDDYGVAYAQSAKRKGYYAKAGFRYATQVDSAAYPKCVIID